MDPEANTVPETGAASDDVRTDVLKAFEAHGVPTEQSQTLEPAAAPAADAQPLTADRPRNERGQFIKADGTVDTEAEAAKVTDADPAKVTPVQPSPAVEAPKSWSAEAKAEFDKLSPAIQQAVIKRESEINDGGARWSEEKKTLLGHFEPVREISEQYKAHPAEVIKRLAAADRFLERDPGNAIRWLAEAYKVDLSKLAATPAATPSTPSQPQADPMVAELKSEISTLKGRFEAEDQRAVNSTLTSFATAKDATGNPAHPHYETVKADMGYLLLAAAQAGRELTLDQAYEQAVWASPDIRPQLIAAQTANSDAARKAKEKETAEKARRGAISINGSPAAGASGAPKRDYETVEEAARAAWAQHSG